MASVPPRPAGLALILSQIGALAAEKFGARLEPLGVTQAQAGILRLIASIPACSQQVLAERLGVYPSRMVALLYQLTEKGLVERRRSEVSLRQRVRDGFFRG